MRRLGNLKAASDIADFYLEMLSGTSLEEIFVKRNDVSS